MAASLASNGLVQRTFIQWRTVNGRKDAAGGSVASVKEAAPIGKRRKEWLYIVWLYVLPCSGAVAVGVRSNLMTMLYSACSQARPANWGQSIRASPIRAKKETGCQDPHSGRACYSRYGFVIDIDA